MAGVQLNFCMLGALEVRVSGRRVVLRSSRQRTMLALLLLSADRVVSTDSLVEAIWNGQPPATGRTQVAICVAALRKTFKTAGCDDEVIATVPPGYLLRSSGHRIDTVEFAEKVAAAHAAEQQGEPAQAADLLGSALDLWRGPALAGVSGHPVEIEAARLEEQRLTAYETRTALRLELGEHGVLISELAAMVCEHPLREQLRAQLMLAQYRAGRRAEALETFRAGRQHCVEEIGIEPGPTLQQMHGAILRDDPSLAPTRQLDAMLTPAQMPADQSGFVGRTEELATLDNLLRAADTAHAPAIGMVTGSAGVGKTALALRWGHRVADRFPAGQLFADLRGYDQSEPPRPPADVLAEFLRALGVPNDRIPAAETERATLYRSILDRRRMLVILDNARSHEQISPLLPGNGGCCVVVTGRTALSGPSAVRVRLGPLPDAEAEALIRRIVRDARVQRDPGGMTRLGELCGRLPLALRICAARLAAKPHWTVRDLVSRLEDHRRRLDELHIGNAHLRLSLEPSYRSLTQDAARMYRRLGLLETTVFDSGIGAALMDTDVPEAERLIEQLVDTHLVDVQQAGATVRYRLTDLVRLHAREHAYDEENSTQRGAAQQRVQAAIESAGVLI